MSEQYDQIAELYHETIQELPLRELAETFTFFRTPGDIQGQSALDQPHAPCLEATRP